MGPDRGESTETRAVRPLTLAAVVAVLGWLAMRTHQTGHDWGDDFALYIRQARGIVDGFAHQVEADNRFALQASGWSTFSPAIYPWGWPLLMAPVVALVGVDYEAIKLLVVALWCAALVFWFLVVRDRMPAVRSWVALAALGLSWPYVVSTNSALSDIPYLAAAFGCLWWLDVCRRRRAWDEGHWWRLAVLGATASFAFNVRREGLALVVTIGALLAVQLVVTWRSEGMAGCRQRWRRWVMPFVSFVLTSSALQIVLPSVIERYPGTGLSNVDDRLGWYHDILAQQLGVLSPGSDTVALFGSSRLGIMAMTAVVTLAIVGLVGRCMVAPETDLPIAVFGVVHTAAVLTAPFQEGRYLFPIVPVLVYFALQALPTLAHIGGFHRVRPFAAVGALLVVALAISSGRETVSWGNGATDLRDAGQIVNGPARPEAIEMTQAVLDITAPDDVVAFFRARAMTMLTDRRSLQAGSIEPILAGADWYVMERGSTYSQPLLNDDEAHALGLEEVWSNEGWVMFRVPHLGG